MTPDSTRGTPAIHRIAIAAAFAFILGLVLGSFGIMAFAVLLLVFGASAHLVGFARPIPQHFRKPRPPVRYTR